MPFPNNSVIAVTGATGFVGRHLVNALVERGHHVRALARRPQAPREGVTWVSGDFDNPDSLVQLLAGATAIIHLAGLVKALTRAEFFAVNEGSVAALLAATTHMEKRPRFILVSSLAAREPQLSHYAASKRAGELKLLDSDIESLILRPAAVYGPGDTEMLKIFKSLKSGVAPIPGSATNRLSLIHVDDVISAILASLEALPTSEPLELDDGHDGGYSMAEFLEIAASAMGVKPVKLVLPGALVRLSGLLNAGLARVTGRAAIFTHKKANEALHADWVARSAPARAHLQWAPLLDAHHGLPEVMAAHTAAGEL